MLANIVIESGRWEVLKAPLIKIRTEVFLNEQHVPIEIEWDQYDANAIHLLVQDQTQQAIACARILQLDVTGNIARIGRMAVLKPYRGMGLGRAIVDAAIKICQQNKHQKVAISSQTHAIKFYQQAGFVVVSEAYIDANIWHVDMERDIS